MTIPSVAFAIRSSTLTNNSNPNGMPISVYRINPPGATKMDLFPVLNYDYPCN